MHWWDEVLARARVRARVKAREKEDILIETSKCFVLF